VADDFYLPLNLVLSATFKGICH